MSKETETQLLKGLLPLLLISAIGDGESYGFEIVVRLREVGMAEIAEGTVYPALSRMEKDGQLKSRLAASAKGPARRYYRVTAKGEALRREIEQALDGMQGVIRAVAHESKSSKSEDNQ